MKKQKNLECYQPPSIQNNIRTKIIPPSANLLVIGNRYHCYVPTAFSKLNGFSPPAPAPPPMRNCWAPLRRWWLLAAQPQSGGATRGDSTRLVGQMMATGCANLVWKIEHDGLKMVKQCWMMVLHGCFWVSNVSSGEGMLRGWSTEWYISSRKHNLRSWQW